MLICFSFVYSPREEARFRHSSAKIISFSPLGRHRDKHPPSDEIRVTGPCATRHCEHRSYQYVPFCNRRVSVKRLTLSREQGYLPLTRSSYFPTYGARTSRALWRFSNVSKCSSYSRRLPFHYPAANLP